MGVFNKIFVLGWVGSLFCSASWYEQPEKGWLWYKRPSTPKSIVSTKNTQDQSKKSEKTYSDKLKDFQKNFSEIKAKAVLQPTLTNVQELQKAQNAMMTQATNFSKIWMLASLLSSESYRSSDNPSPKHREINLAQKEKDLDAKIRSMARRYGLFFLFKKECLYCHEFAPVVRQIMDRYGFETKAISPDGESLLDFPDVEKDNGTIKIINPEGIYPILFLINPHTRQVIPLSRGLVNFSQVRENFDVIIQSLEGSSNDS